MERNRIDIARIIDGADDILCQWNPATWREGDPTLELNPDEAVPEIREAASMICEACDYYIGDMNDILMRRLRLAWPSVHGVLAEVMRLIKSNTPGLDRDSLYVIRECCINMIYKMRYVGVAKAIEAARKGAQELEESGRRTTTPGGTENSPGAAEMGSNKPQRETHKTARGKGRPKETLKDKMINDADGEKWQKIHNVWGDSKGKDASLIIVACIKMGWMKRPTYTQVKDEFGDIGSKTGYNHYLDSKKFTHDEIEGIMNTLKQA